MKLSLKLIAIVCFFISSSVSAQSIPRWKLADLEAAMNNADKPTIINFWATFCKPCIEEIPYFQQVLKHYDTSKVRLILVSLDLPEAYKNIPAFAKKRKITAPIVYLNETNADIFCPRVDPSWSGTIPASIFINNKAGYRKFFEDQLTRKEFTKQVELLLGSGK